MAGCSSDVTRFSFLGGGSASPTTGSTAAGYAPAGRGYASGPTGDGAGGMQETSLPPLKQAAAAPSGPDRPPWSDRDPPPWTDKDPLPWPSAAVGRRTDRSPAAAKAPAAPVAPRIVQVAPRSAGPAGPEAKSADEPAPAQRTAKNDATMSDASPQPAPASGKFRWPARGKIISGFGPQPDGSKSDGINLAVPMGTDIHAVEAGSVHYAADGLKGYGNLILIRHPNGWSSAYAHADQILVKVGDQVKRGQVIGKVGKSGPVAQPQLRFELRKGSVPVDPVPYLAN
jgi:murein DD-endopeptidase MepM/ murein hydrolase activator NlpD